jgi:hypothetical protein
MSHLLDKTGQNGTFREATAEPQRWPPDKSPRFLAIRLNRDEA